VPKISTSKFNRVFTSMVIAMVIAIVLVSGLLSGVLPVRADNRNIAQEQAIKNGVTWLVSRQSAEGGWEPYTVVSGNVLAIRAYASMGNRSSFKFNLLLNRLKELQSPDGSWDDDILNTAYAVWALNEAREDMKSPAIQNAVSWLKKQDDFTDTSMGNTKDISLTIIALLKAGEPQTSPLIADGIKWLKNNQNPDGFWGNLAGEASVSWVKEAVIALVLAESASSPQVQKAVGYLRNHYSEYHGYDAIEGLEVFAYAGDASLITAGQTKVLSEQNKNDSGWGKLPGWPSVNAETARAVFSLGQSGYSGDSLNNTLQWIESHISEAGDYQGDYVVVAPTAWAILGLSAVQSVSPSIYTSMIDQATSDQATIDQATGLLLGSQNHGWGWWSIYYPEVIGSETDNTGLCAWALHQSGTGSSSDALQQAAAALISGQNADGGWGAAWLPPTGGSTVSSTDFALTALLCAGYSESNSNLKRGIEYLLANSLQGHWESVGKTAMSSIILKKTSYSDQLLNTAIEWLVQNQNDDGGWGRKKGEVSNVTTTAMTMVALHESGKGEISLARGAAWLMAAQNADGGWSNLAGVPSSTTAGTAQAVWALTLAEYTPALELEVSLNQTVYYPGDLAVIKVSSSNEISHLDLRLIDPSGKVTPLDVPLVPVTVPDSSTSPDGSSAATGSGTAPGSSAASGSAGSRTAQISHQTSYQITYQTTYQLDANAPAGTYILSLNADSPTGSGIDAASFAVYPLHPCYRDADFDGFGDPEALFLNCHSQVGYVSNHDDCNDSDPNINPAAREICDGLDNDCDGAIDEGFPPSACCHKEGCTPHECEEDDSGEIDIKGARGRAEEEIWVAVRIQNSPSQVSALGFSITYDANVLEYKGFERGDLVTFFALFGVNSTGSGSLRVGGLTSKDAIQQGASGYLVRLKFRVKDSLEGERSPLQLQALTDHIAQFTHSGGCFAYIDSNDINGDESITLEDARAVLDCYLGSGPCSDYFDVNKDGSITPLDALLIFEKCQEISIQPPQN